MLVDDEHVAVPDQQRVEGPMTDSAKGLASRARTMLNLACVREGCTANPSPKSIENSEMNLNVRERR